DTTDPGCSSSGRRKPGPEGGPCPPPPPISPLREMERDAVIIGDSIVQYVHVNDTKLRQTEVLKRDFRSLIETVRSTSPTMRIIVSGPLPMLFVNNWNLFWERPRLFRADGLHPSRVGAELLSDNISRTLCSI
ncbi:hypothetical protein M9458_021335, partial [Cirrhinus mrigala]